MIVLDTNVISEAMKKEPDPDVLNWLNEQSAETLHLPSVVLAELLFGIAMVPAGKRKNMLTQALNGVSGLFAERVLSFDAASAAKYADIMARARSVGLAINTADGFIAAIAAANKMTVATRDIGPFQAAGISVVNPWATAN